MLEKTLIGLPILSRVLRDGMMLINFASFSETIRLITINFDLLGTSYDLYLCVIYTCASTLKRTLHLPLKELIGMIIIEDY